MQLSVEWCWEPGMCAELAFTRLSCGWPHRDTRTAWPVLIQRNREKVEIATRNGILFCMCCATFLEYFWQVCVQ